MGYAGNRAAARVRIRIRCRASGASSGPVADVRHNSTVVSGRQQSAPAPQVEAADRLAFLSRSDLGFERKCVDCKKKRSEIEAGVVCSTKRDENSLLRIITGSEFVGTHSSNWHFHTERIYSGFLLGTFLRFAPRSDLHGWARNEAEFQPGQMQPEEAKQKIVHSRLFGLGSSDPLERV